MKIRPYQSSDAPALAVMAEVSGFPYIQPDSPMVEACMVVEDSDGNILAAVAAKRICELYLWKDAGISPAMAQSIIKSMHMIMANKLRALGYDEANTFLHPSICERFGRRLQRSFGWVRNWPSFAVKF